MNIFFLDIVHAFLTLLRTVNLFDTLDDEAENDAEVVNEDLFLLSKTIISALESETIISMLESDSVPDSIRFEENGTTPCCPIINAKMFR